MPKEAPAPEAAAPAPAPTVACTVLVANTTYQDAEFAVGAKVRLPQDAAQQLESLGKLRIDGI
jgi:hypothetical protein